MKIIRVFPRRTKASPRDPLAYFGPPDLFAEADEVHVSVTFSYDLPKAEKLAEQWRHVAPVKIGGPATGERGEEFTPGMYLRHGLVVTSRGCPNSCWFCEVWKREGRKVRELQIVDGWNVIDDNLLACSVEHIKAVFSMLSHQKRRPMFTGGLEAARLTAWVAAELRKLKPEQLYFAYDTPDDYEPLIEARKLLDSAGFPKKRHSLGCYVLCGYPSDTMPAAASRMRQVVDAGFTPFAMLYRDKKGRRDPEWRKFQRVWARPAITHRVAHMDAPGGPLDRGGVTVEDAEKGHAFDEMWGVTKRG